MTDRRTFLASAGALAAAFAIDPDELRAASTPRAQHASSWDTSWIKRVADAEYRVVFNASEVADGAAMNYAWSFFNDFHEVHGTSDGSTRPVIVFRRLGTPMALNDAMWERYAIGEDLKLNDPVTKARATRNVYWKAVEGTSAQQATTMLESLMQRGLVSLVCNVALGNWARYTAQKTGKDAAALRDDAVANLIPGAILVPSGIYALIRAQNAGCAWMPGT